MTQLLVLAVGITCFEFGAWGQLLGSMCATRAGDLAFCLLGQGEF